MSDSCSFDSGSIKSMFDHCCTLEKKILISLLSMQVFSFSDDLQHLYPFFYRPMFEVVEDGWQAFTPEAELSRMKHCSDKWRLTHVNKNYQVREHAQALSVTLHVNTCRGHVRKSLQMCPSYPEVVFAPRSISDDVIAQSARFRQGGRFPVLSYYHRENKTSLLRSSQPMTGPNKRRCKQDAELLNSVLGQSRT